MAISNKISKEELDRKINESVEDIEDTDTPPTDQDNPNEDNDLDTDLKNTDTPEDNDNPENKDDDPNPENKDQDKNTPPSLEDRYAASTQEAQILHSRQKEINEAFDKADKLPEPTEEELKAEYPDWDKMSPTEKRFAKDILLNKRKFSTVNEVAQKGKKLDEWIDQVDNFIKTEVGKYPRLVGHESEFKSFAIKPSRRGVDFEVLVSSFLFNLVEKKEDKGKKKGSLFNKGGGGRPEKKDNADQYADPKQVKMLRQKNQKLYMRLVREGKIKIKI